MLSINNIIDILSPKQIKIENNNKEIIKDIEKKKYLKLFKTDDELYIYNYDIRIKNELLNFISSILIIFDDTFLLTEKKYKIEKIKTLINKMIIDYDNNNYYYKFYFNKNKKIRKSLIQTLLYDLLNKKHIENIHNLQQFISDYFSINIFILTNEITNVKLNNDLYFYKFFNTNQYNNKINKLCPTIILYKNNNNYYPILNNNKFLLYSKHKKLLKIIYEHCGIFIEEYLYNKKSIAELRNICLSLNLSIKKKSELTGKNIYIKKNELLYKIRLSYEF